MDVREVLAALRVERDQVITVIENLERLAVSREHRRGSRDVCEDNRLH